MFWHGICGMSIAVAGVLIDAWINSAENPDGIQLFHYDSRVYLLMLGGALIDSVAVNSVTIAY